MKWRRLFGIVLACGMLAGCSATPSSQPQSNTATDGDYTLTIASSQSAYKASELKPGQLLDVTVTYTYTYTYSNTYTYTGDQSDITVQHSDPLCLVDIADASGQSLLNRAFADVSYSTVLHSKQPVTLRSDGSAEYEAGKLTKGDYKAIAYLQLSTKEDPSADIQLKAEIPFTIY